MHKIAVGSRHRPNKSGTRGAEARNGPANRDQLGGRGSGPHGKPLRAAINNKFERASRLQRVHRQSSLSEGHQTPSSNLLRSRQQQPSKITQEPDVAYARTTMPLRR